MYVVSKYYNIASVMKALHPHFAYFVNLLVDELDEMGPPATRKWIFYCKLVKTTDYCLLG